MYAAANISSVLAPRLVKSRPELLIAGSSRIRHLLFVVPEQSDGQPGISAIAYSTIGFTRLMLAATVCFLLGRWYGARGFAWLDGQLGDQRPAALRWLERAADRVGWLLLLLMPGSNIVCALVGHRGMQPKRFFGFVSAGVVLRLVWVWLAAKQWEEQLKDILDWIGRYQWWLIGGFLALTVAQSMRRSRAIKRAVERPTQDD